MKMRSDARGGGERLRLGRGRSRFEKRCPFDRDLERTEVPRRAARACARLAGRERRSRGRRRRNRLETKPKRRSLLFFVTVCDANAHGLREGDGVAFIDPLAEDTDDVARKRRGAETRDPLTERARSRSSGEGRSWSIASPHAFAVSIDEAESLGGGHDAARLAGRYVRQRRRRDARERPPRVSAPFGNALRTPAVLTNANAGSTRPNETSRRNEPTTTEATGGNAGISRNVVAPTDVRGVSSFVYGRNAATVAPAVAAARVATAFLRLGRKTKTTRFPAHTA